MSVKSILTFHFLEEPIEHLDAALQTASNLDAHLDVVVVGIEMAPPADIHGGFPSEYWQDYNQKVRADIDKRKAEIKSKVEKSGASATVSCESAELSAIGQLIRPHALCTDITLMSHALLEQSTSAKKTFDAVLFDTRRPILVHCGNAFDKSALENVIIGWNGSVEAATAIHMALPLLIHSGAAHIVIVDPDPSVLGANPGDDLALMLSRHGVNAVVSKIPSEGHDAGEALLEFATDKQAGLLVMGAYGNSRLREWLLGGATRSVLGNAQVPVLMAH